MPEVMIKAIDEICIAAQAQGSRLWLDAEQQVLQHGLDDWAIEIMRKHNPIRNSARIQHYPGDI
jgi:hypothetical protein